MAWVVANRLSRMRDRIGELDMTLLAKEEEIGHLRQLLDEANGMIVAAEEDKLLSVKEGCDGTGSS